MASKSVIKYTCDRCGRTYDEEASLAQQKQPRLPAAMVEAHLQAADVTPLVVRFDDLCSRCDRRVADLIKQIALDDTKKGVEGEAQLGEPSLDDKAKPSDNKGKADAGKAAEKSHTPS